MTMLLPSGCLSLLHRRRSETLKSLPELSLEVGERQGEALSRVLAEGWRHQEHTADSSR